MTDKEIIKALECCAEEKCWECLFEPTKFKKGTFGCCDELKKCALDLINQQQAEIEKLQIRLRKERHQFADIGKMYSEIKAEAIKEFADRLKEKIGDSHFQNYGLAILEIHDLIKEMVGDDK